MFDIKNCFTAALATNVLPQTFTGDGTSTNSLDLDKAGIAIAGGKGQYLVIKSIAAFNTLTSLEIILQSSDVTGFGSGLKEVFAINIALADLSAGALLVNQQIPVQKYQQFMRLKYNVVGSDNTVGSLLAYLQDHPEPAETQLDTVAL